MTATRRDLLAACGAMVAPGFTSIRPLGAATCGARIPSVEEDAARAIEERVARWGLAVLPAGTLELRRPVVLEGDCTIVGAGRSTRILVKHDRGPAFRVTRARRVRFSGFGLVGAGARSRHDSDGIRVTARESPTDDVEIVAVDISDVGGAGLMILGAPEAPVRAVSIIGCTILRTGAHGVVCQDHCSNVRIERNVVRDFGLGYPDRPGITTGRHGRSHAVVGNIVEGTLAAAGASVHGISIDTAIDAVVAGNQVERVLGYGIEIAFSRRVTVASNLVRNCRRAAIGVPASAEMSTACCRIRHNLLAGCYQGVFLLSQPGNPPNRDVRIERNLITDCRVGLYAVGVDRLSAEDNTVIRPLHLAFYLMRSLDPAISCNTILLPRTRFATVRDALAVDDAHIYHTILSSNFIMAAGSGAPE